MNRLTGVVPERVRPWVVLAAFLVIGWFAAVRFDAPTTSLIVLGLYYAAAGTSFNFLFGSLGVFSLAQPVFLAVGGYTGVKLYNTFGISPWIALILAPIIAGIIALPGALAAVRAGGGAVLTALITLILAQVVPPILIGIKSLGGAVGLYVDPPKGSPEAVMQFAESGPFVRILLVVNVLLIAFWMWWRRSRFGFYSAALHDSPEASQAVGVPNTRLKVAMFVIAAMMAAPAGVVYAQYNLLTTPDLFFGSVALFQVIVVALVGGAARPWGALVGSLLITFLSAKATDLAGGRPGVGPLTFAAIFVIMALLLPRGLSGTWARYADRWRRRTGRGSTAADGAPVAPEADAPRIPGPELGPEQDEIRQSLTQT
jgi:branched-chain amino acid transport system permease protein